MKEQSIKKYSIIYIDPPWTYNDKALSGNRGVEFKYPTMDIEAIKSLPINQIADQNCILICWATFPLLPDALDAIKAWGFTYKTCAFNWVKLNKVNPTRFFGMGNYTRSNSEVCLLAVKGKPKRNSASVSQIIEADEIFDDEYWETELIKSPIQVHSQKPAIVHEKIVQLMGDLPRIEIFARENVEGWDCIGNGIDGKDIRISLKRIIDG